MSIPLPPLLSSILGRRRNLPILLHLLDNLPRRLKRLHARRYPGINHRVSNRLADLLLRQPVADRAPRVRRQLGPPIQAHQDPDVEQRALLPREALAAPGAPADLRHVFLDGLAEGVGACCEGSVDVVVAEDLAADFEPLLEIGGFV